MIKSGTRIGEYEIQKLLGSGGMGEVFRAHDSRLGRDVAIKVLPRILATDSERLKRFEQEARATAVLNHPNILVVFRMGTHEGAPYLVSELLEGATLREQLVRGPLPVRKAIDYGIQIARGLAAAHDRGIAHRDLKPDNLFVTKDGHVKILDFGLAKLIQVPRHAEQNALTADTGTEPGMVMGTVGYMSPEQVRGRSADHRSDIFAFGAAMYEMLSGKRAFHKPTSAETMTAILNEEPPSVSQTALNVPPGLQRIVHRCLEKNPEQRFQSASDLAFALEALSDSGSASAATIAQTKPKVKWRWRAVAAAAAIIAALVLWWEQPAAMPHIEGIVQLTHDGQPKPIPTSLASDGSRVYFPEQNAGVFGIAQVSVAGGETVPLATSLENPMPLDIAPDSSVLLVSYGTQDESYLGELPLPGGQVRKIARGESAAFFPDGQHIVYCSGPSMYVAQKDGSNSRKISDVGCYDGRLPPVISPDGTRIRFVVPDRSGPPVYKEIQADGTRLQQLDGPVKGWNGKWVRNGKFFVFERNENWRTDLWIRPEKTGILSRSGLPFRFTNGPLSFDAPLPSRDRSRIYAIGYQNRGELVRYDPSSRQFLPVLDGISATDLVYSADGEWLIYLSYPDHDLWRIRADGSDRMQLTYPPVEVYWPHISPDAKEVEFLGYIPRKGMGTYIVDITGGDAKFVNDSPFSSAWSYDGKSLLVNVQVAGKKVEELNTEQLANWQLAIFNLKSGAISTIPNSQGKVSAFQLSPHLIVASGQQGALYWFDLTTQKWSMLADGPINTYMPSPDLQYMYFVRETPGNPQAMRVRMSDHNIEAVASLKGLRRIADPAIGGGSWIGVAPDGSVLLTRDTGTQEIYAIDVKWP